MTFRKTADAQLQHLGSLTVDADGNPRTRRIASAEDAQTSYYLDGSAKIDVGGILKRVASRYAISDDPSDYIFEAIRANTSSVFNDNHDGFSREELLRFDPKLKTAVYLTYREKPHHVNHRTANPKRARGVIIDAHYNAEATPLEECPGCGAHTSKRANRDKSGVFCKKCGTVVNDEFTEILVAVDAKKDPTFARGVREGQLRFGSMGCTCVETVCNVCDNVARSRKEFCKHIASHKGSYWQHTAANQEWTKVNPKTAAAEFKKRGRNFNEQDFVMLRADDGYEVRKAAEWCQGVEFDEYSRVHMPADPKAEQREVLNRAASAGDPTPEDLHAETTQLVAAAGLRDRRRNKAAAQEKTAMKFVVVRVDGDPLDTYAAETLDQALSLAGADDGSKLEMAEVEADDAGAARLMVQDSDFMPMQDHQGMHQMESDVTINIDEGVGGEEVETLVDDAPQSIEDFTDDVMDPEPETPGDEEFSPEELGVMPAGASKEAASMKESSYADWKVQVTPRGNAQVVSPHGPVLLIQASKENSSDKERLAFGREIMDHLSDHGLYRTASKYDAAYHAKFASVVDYAMDDMKEFSDKDTKPDVSGGGMTDMAGEMRGKYEDDVRAEDISDMQGERQLEVDSTDENRASDHELGNNDSHPDSSTENEGSDMREKREPFSMSDSALDNAVMDHSERVARWVQNTRTGERRMVASYNKEAQQFTLVDQKLQPTEVKEADLLSQWKQLDSAPADINTRLAALEKRMKTWAQAEVAKARREATAETFRAVRIAAQRQAKGMQLSPLKVAMATELANDKVVGHDAVSKAPLEYRGMADELAIHLVEAAYSESSEAEIDNILNSAAALLKHDAAYLKSAEADLAKVAYRVAPVTAATMVDDLDREAEALRRQATAGNLELSSSAAPATSAGEGESRGSIRSALGATRAGARSQFRH